MENKKLEIAKDLAKHYVRKAEENKKIVTSLVTCDGDLTIIVMREPQGKYIVTMITGEGALFDQARDLTLEEATTRTFNQWMEEYLLESKQDLFDRFESNRIRRMEIAQ